MHIVKSVCIGCSYRTTYICDDSVRGLGENPIEGTHFEQGFSWLPGCLAFFSLYSNAEFKADVFLDEPVQLKKDVVRAIQVPFTVFGDKGLIIYDGLSIEPVSIMIPKGNYVLVVEQGYDVEPPRDIETGETEMWCRLWFNQSNEPVEPKILVQDAELNPQYPLRLDGLEDEK